MRMLGQAVAFIIGLALLLPGACSLTYLGFALTNLASSPFTPQTWRGFLDTAPVLVPVWAIGLLLGVVGVRVLLGLFRGPPASRR